MNVLTIQSSVAFGHVGNAAAVPVLQRLGIAAWPLDTVQLSNHTDHASWAGGPVAASRLAEIVDGLARLDALAMCDALLTGYLGDAEQGAVVVDVLDRLRAGNGRALYLCDPVMGNAAKGVYVRDGVAGLIRERLAPAADVVTPNAFELGLLAGRAVAGLDDALAAARAVRALGPDIVVCTSLETAPDEIATLAVVEGVAWLVRTPRLDVAANGAGDVLAAALLGRLLTGASVPDALALAVSSTFAVLAASRDAGGRDLALVAALDAIVDPPERFAAEPVGSC